MLYEVITLDVDSMADLEEAVGLYLKSAANRFLGNGQLADEQLEMALSIDKDVVYKARFESSFVKLNVRYVITSYSIHYTKLYEQ